MDGVRCDHVQHDLDSPRTDDRVLHTATRDFDCDMQEKAGLGEASRN